MPTGSPSTPTPFRTNAPTGQTHSRSQYEQEMWDDLANVVYYDSDSTDDSVTGGTSLDVCTLDIPCPVKCRLEIHLMVLITSPGATILWDAHINVDGTNQQNSGQQESDASSRSSAVAVLAHDVEPGTHTVQIRINSDTTAGFHKLQLLVRRGRTPPS